MKEHSPRQNNSIDIKQNNPTEINEKFAPKILVAEDNPDVRELLVENLKSRGCVVVEVKDGEELWNALNKLSETEKNTYVLVITDNNMPKTSGIEVLERIRADSRFNDLKVIMYSTGLNNAELEIVNGYKDNTSFVAKSGNYENILKKVEEMLSMFYLARDERIMDRRLALLKSVPKEKILEVWVRLAERSDYLKNKYQDYTDRTVYHAFIGSTVRGTRPNLVEDDFPGSDSVEKILEDLIKEYQGKYSNKD